MNSSKRKSLLLGMPLGTASGRLRKSVMFMLMHKAGMATCYRCRKEILTCDQLSIEHKNPWERAPDPLAAFLDINNIAFSHYLCNVAAAARPHKRFASRKEQNRHNSRLQNSDPVKRAKKDAWRRRKRYGSVAQLERAPIS